MPDETDTPAADAPNTGSKPRRARQPRAKAAATPKLEGEAGSAEASDAPATKPKRAPAKPATRRAPARKTASRSTGRTAAPRGSARTRSDAASESGWQAYAPIAGAAGVGIALGLLAALGRKAAVQAPTALAGDWATALAAEHKVALALFDKLEATEPGATAKRAALLAQLKHALARHALEEENVIYPALRQTGRTAEADELNAEHGYVKQYLYELENSPKGTPEWLAKLRQFRSEIEDHMREEEDKLFPALRGELTDEQNKALAAAMNKEGFKLA